MLVFSFSLIHSHVYPITDVSLCASGRRTNRIHSFVMSQEAAFKTIEMKEVYKDSFIEDWFIVFLQNYYRSRRQR